MSNQGEEDTGTFENMTDALFNMVNEGGDTPEPEPELEAATDEGEEQSDPEPEPEPEIEAQGEAPPKKAQKRIQQLVQRSKEAESKNEELLALVEQLKKGNELQSQMQERQLKYLDSQDEIAKQQARVANMQKYGFDPSNEKDINTYSQFEYNTQLEQEIQQLKTLIEEQQTQTQVERFNNALDKAINKELKEFAVSEGLREKLKQSAYRAAYVEDMSAAKAAKAVVDSFKEVLPKTKKVKAAKPDNVDKVVATGNRSQGKTTGKSDKPSFLEMINSGDFFN